MPEEITRQDFWELANTALGLAGAVACLIALALGMYFVRSIW